MITKNNSITLLVLSWLFFFNTVSLKSYPNSNYILITDQQTPLQESMARGKDLYAEFCIQCHLATGKGNGDIVPPLDNSDWLSKKKTESIYAIKFGQTGEITVNSKKYNGTMPQMGLSNEEVADVMNYICNSWSNKQNKMITAEEAALVKP